MKSFGYYMYVHVCVCTVLYYDMTFVCLLRHLCKRHEWETVCINFKCNFIFTIYVLGST